MPTPTSRPRSRSRPRCSLAGGVPFISDTQLEAALAEADVPPEVAQEAVEINSTSRLDGLRTALSAVVLIGIIGLFFTGRIPDRAIGAAAADSKPEVDEDERCDRLDGLRVHPQAGERSGPHGRAETKRAEEAGFTYGWLFDSHVLWREPYRAADAHGPGHRADAAGHLRHQPGHPRAECHSLHARRAERADRRAHGPGHRPRRQRAPGARQAADHA